MSTEVIHGSFFDRAEMDTTPGVVRDIQEDIVHVKQETETSQINETATRNITVGVPDVTIKIEQDLDCELKHHYGESGVDKVDTRPHQVHNLDRIMEVKGEEEVSNGDNGDFGKCMVEYKNDCRVHGSLVYMDNAEVFSGSSNTEGLDTEICKVDMFDDRDTIGEEELSQVVPCRGDTDQCSCIQCCSHVDSWQHGGKSLNRTTQHEGFSDRLSEHNINILMAGVNKNRDVNCVTTGGDREQYTPLRLTERKVSMNVIDCQKMSIDMNITQKNDNVSLPDVEGSRQSEHESCVSEKNIKIESDTGSKLSDSEHAHAEIQIERTLYNSDVCDVGFSQRDTPKNCADEKPYKCDICGIGISGAGHLKRHKRIHTGEKPYKCDVCGAGFSRIDSLNCHRTTHTGEIPIKCDVCLAEFVTLGLLKKHKRIHREKKPYKCEVCGVGLSRRSALKNHKRIHTGEKPYKCDVCGVEMSEPCHLKRHKRIHTGEKPYKCDFCGFAFSRKGPLNNHIRIHTGEKPFKCDVCGVAFSRADDLKVHKRTHTGEKPYKCDICDVSFFRASVLKNHIKIHIREKLHKCDVCDVAFSRAGDLKSHNRIHTLDKTLQV